MSLDFQAFFRTKPKALPQGNAGEGWVLNVEAPLRIEPEDLPPGLLALIARARWQVDIHLEGVASGPALEALSATADTLVQDGAAVLD
jgi:hypothetical protein